MLLFNDTFSRVCFVFGIIFLTIALATYFTGCNPDAVGGCTPYKPFSPGYIYDHQIIKQRCKECTSRRDGKCKHYRYYDCYSAYAYADKGANSSSWCKMQVSYHTEKKSDAEDELDKYPIGKEVNWLKQRNSDICRTPQQAYTLWVVGVVFFGLFGLAFSIPFGSKLYDQITDRQSSYSSPADEKENAEESGEDRNQKFNGEEQDDKFDGAGAVQMT